MSLLSELQARGVTIEDLEKAAAVRLFEKAASAEGVNLDTLPEDQVSSLFEQFQAATNSSTKEASAMSDEVIDLFEKTAAAEGIDLDEMSDEDLAALYEHYVENVLPAQIEEAESQDKEAMVSDAQEKLAEAEILGRHMARAYADEMGKIAESGMVGKALKGTALLGTGTAIGAVGKTQYDKRKARKAAEADEQSKSASIELSALLKIASIYGEKVATEAAEAAAEAARPATAAAAPVVEAAAAPAADAAKKMPMSLAKKLGIAGAATTLTAAGAYGGKKMYDRRKARMSAESAPADDAGGEKDASAVNEMALYLLRQAGYAV